MKKSILRNVLCVILCVVFYGCGVGGINPLASDSPTPVVSDSPPPVVGGEKNTGVSLSTLKDPRISIDLSESKTWESEPNLLIYPRVKPSKKPLIDLALQMVGSQMMEPSTSEYIVYASRRLVDGTYKTDPRESRIGLQTIRANGDITIDLYLDSNSYVNLTNIELILAESSNLVNTSSSGEGHKTFFYAMIDLGGGHFQRIISATDHPECKYVGARVRLTPTSITHWEYFVVKQLTVKQNLITLFDSSALVNGIDWHKNVPKNELAFFTSTKVPDSLQDIYITHTGCISGAVRKYVYASPSGLKSNTGDYLHPLDLRSAAVEFNNGAEYLILQEGAYDLSSTQGTVNFLYPGQANKGIIALNAATVKLSKTVLASDFTAESGVHKYIYDTKNHYLKTQIDEGKAPILIYSDESFNHPSVDSLTLCQTTVGSQYWNAATHSLYVNFSGGLPVDVFIPQGKYFLSSDIAGNLDVVNLSASGSEYGQFLISNKNVRMFNVTAWGASYGDNLEFTNSNVRLVDCTSRYSMKLDGFGFNTKSTEKYYSEMYDCIGTDNWDNGVSHHHSSVGYIQGGDYSRNGHTGGGGVTPAFGAEVTVYRTTVKNSVKEMAFRVIGDRDNRAHGIFVECITDNNEKAYMSTGNSEMEVVSPNIGINDIFGICNQTYYGLDAGWVTTGINDLIRLNLADRSKLILR